jgi:hypothetical protein
VTEEDIQENYLRIKQDITDLFKEELSLLQVKEVLEDSAQQPSGEPKEEEEKSKENEEVSGQTISM